MPSYGGSIAQNVYYSQSTLCDSNVDTSTGVPARENDPKTGKMKPWPSPYILMVDRGDCTFVQKVCCRKYLEGSPFVLFFRRLDFTAEVQRRAPAFCRPFSFGRDC